MELSYPQAARPANGRSMDRVYHWVGPDGEILSIANCRIPATPRAAEILDRRLGHDARKNERGGTLECGSTANPCTLYTTGNSSGVYWGEDDDWWDDGDDCGNGWISFCDRSGSDYGGGGGGSPDPYSNGCDPSRDPACEVKLTEADISNIQNAIDTYIRTPEEIVDNDNARAQCKAMYDKFVSMLNADPPAVFRGSYTTQTGDVGIEPHSGAYDEKTKHIHFEPSLLDAAALGNPDSLRSLANTGLHEAAHALGFDHAAPINSPWGPLYTENYFNKLDAGDDSCMK